MEQRKFISSGTGSRSRLASQTPNDEPSGVIWDKKMSEIRSVVLLALSQPVVIPVVALLALAGVTEWLGYNEIAGVLLIGAVVSGAIAWVTGIHANQQSRLAIRQHAALAGELRYADLTNVDLSGAYLRERNFEGVRMSNCTAQEVDFSGTSLRDARLTKGIFSRGMFDGADLTRAGCYSARLNGASLKRVVAVQASLCRANLKSADLTGADLREADLRGADLTGATITQADLRGAWYSSTTRFPDGDVPEGCVMMGDGLAGRLRSLQDVAADYPRPDDRARGLIRLDLADTAVTDLTDSVKTES
jgi:uncharacterized protein YjbI with pentapeptide repeats